MRKHSNNCVSTLNTCFKNIKGFTLIELMIGVAIIGILTTVAYPSYLDYVTHSNRSEGLRELTRIANLQEQFYVDNHTYTTDISALGVVGATTTSYTTEHGWFIITATIANSGASFKLTAIPQDTGQGKQASNDTSCTSLTIDQTGKKAASDGSNDTTSTCWDN